MNYELWTVGELRDFNDLEISLTPLTVCHTFTTAKSWFSSGTANAWKVFAAWVRDQLDWNQATSSRQHYKLPSKISVLGYDFEIVHSFISNPFLHHHRRRKWVRYLYSTPYLIVLYYSVFCCMLYLFCMCDFMSAIVLYCNRLLYKLTEGNLLYIQVALPTWCIYKVQYLFT